MTDNEEKVVVKDFPKEKFQFVHKDGYEKIHDEKFKTKSTTFFKDGMRRLRKNPLAMASIVVLALIILIILVAPHIVPYSYDEVLTVNGQRDKTMTNLGFM